MSERAGHAAWGCLVLMLISCGGAPVGPVVTPPSFDGLSCEVAAVLQNRCTSCHGATLAGSAPYSLASRADLLAMAPAPYADQHKGQRALARMASSSSPMPPTGAPAATAAEQATFGAWVDAGMPAGSCGAPQVVCTSGSTSSAREGTNMRPGAACQTCHVGQGEARGYTYMGTVFPSFHEASDCNAQPPTGLVVEILSADGRGTVLATLSVSSPSGNFASYGTGAVPYRARVRDATGRTREMQTAPTTGDCNSCHTELGANGAPGRIRWPD